MASVNQARVRSGFDVEALLGEEYLRMLVGTAFDAGLIPGEADFSGTTVRVRMIPPGLRLY